MARDGHRFLFSAIASKTIRVYVRSTCHQHALLEKGV